MHVSGIDIHLRIDTGVLQVLHVSERFGIERFAIGHKGIAGGKIRVVRFAGRGGVLADLVASVLAPQVVLPAPMVPLRIPALVPFLERMIRSRVISIFTGVFFCLSKSDKNRTFAP